MKYFIFLLVAFPAFSAHHYAVLLDDRLDIYRQVVTGLAVEVDEELREYFLEEDPEKNPEVIKKMMGQKPSVAIAIGPRSAAALKVFEDFLLIFCLVPRVEATYHGQSNIAAIRMEAQFKQQLSAFRAILGEKKRVGVLYHPKESTQAIAHAKSAAQKADLSLHPIAVSDVSLVGKALLDNLAKIDGLWIFYDPVAMNITAIDTVLAFSQVHQLPVFTSQEHLVRHGAWAAFSMDYVRLGKQLGNMANDLAKHTSSAKKSGDVVAPEGMHLLLNLRGIQSMADSPAALLRLALLSAKSQYSLVFQE